MLEQVEIGHYAKIPIHIARAKVSKSAKSLWIELALVSSPEKPQVWIRQESLAEKMGVSDRTVRRLIIELEKARLIIPNGWHQGRHKKYDLTWTNLSDVGGQSGQECPTSPDKNVQLRRTETSRDGGQKCPDLNRVFKQNTEQNNIFFNSQPDPQKLLADWGDQWRKRFGCLDGLSGRPSIETCVEQAMSHESRHKYATPKVWCEIWLQNAARQWLVAFNREQNAPATDPNLDAEAKARRSQAESERSRRYYSQQAPLPSSNRNTIPPDLQAQVDKIMAENEVGFTDKLLRLMKQQKVTQRQPLSV